MGIVRKFRKGVKAARMAMKDKERYEDHLKELVSEFLNSKRREWMYIGDRYYSVDNDIKKRKMERIVNGKKVKEENKANNRLAHASYKNMVDEKVAYIFAKEYTLDCKDKVYLKSVQDVLGKRFKHFLMRSGYAASNHGIAWWHPYVDEQGKFKIMLVPASKCLPEWTDNNHEELKAMHYIYDTVYYDGGVKKYRTHVETVALLSKLDVNNHIEVEIELNEMDLTSAESKATYTQIKEYVLEKFGLKVSTLYIAQIKKKCGIALRENYNKSKKEKQIIPQCTLEKEEAIMDALRHFKMI